MAVKPKSQPSLLPRWRVLAGRDVALGPGKAKLLVLVAETGSIRQAARRLGMSYMRAWSLAQTMNTCFQEPLIRTAHGGPAGGGAALTPTGRRVLALYQRMETASLKVVRPDWRALQKLLRS